MNAELTVGSLEERVTVTGESPVVDVQNVRQQGVVSNEVIDSTPSSRTRRDQQLAGYGPNEQDRSHDRHDPRRPPRRPPGHGRRGGRIGRAGPGGVILNVVPKEGGNTFSGSLFVSRSAATTTARDDQSND